MRLGNELLRRGPLPAVLACVLPVHEDVVLGGFLNVEGWFVWGFVILGDFIRSFAYNLAWLSIHFANMEKSCNGSRLC